MYACVYTCECNAFVRRCMHASMYVCVHVCMYAMYVCLHICLYLRLCLHACMYGSICVGLNACNVMS